MSRSREAGDARDYAPQVPRHSDGQEALSRSQARPVGIYLTENLGGLLKIVVWIWGIVSVAYLVGLVFITMFYVFAPPWDDDFRMLPPQGSRALWLAIAAAWVVTAVRVIACIALLGGKRGALAVKLGWTALVATVLVAAVDLFVDVAHVVRGVPGRFTPIPIGIVAILSLAVLLWPETLKWAWTRGERHVPRLDYRGHFPKEQANLLGIRPPEAAGDSRSVAPPSEWQPPLTDESLERGGSNVPRGAPYGSARPAMPFDDTTPTPTPTPTPIVPYVSPLKKSSDAEDRPANEEPYNGQP